MVYLKAFVAGFLATLIFHQGMVALLHAQGVLPPAYPMQGTWPFGVPQVISLAFWGGVWGVILWLLIGGLAAFHRVWLAIVIGAIGPTAVARGIVFPLKGRAVSLDMVPVGLLLNGAWGIGTLLLIEGLRRTLPGR